MSATTRIDALSDETRSWLGRQMSPTTRDRAVLAAVDGASRTGTAVRYALVAGAALVLAAACGMRLWDAAAFMRGGPLMIVGGGLTTGLVITLLAGARARTAWRSAHGTTWLVTTAQLIEMTPFHVRRWDVRGARDVTVKLTQSGGSLRFEQGGAAVHIGFGVAIYGGLTWPAVSAVGNAVAAVGTGSPDGQTFAPVGGASRTLAFGAAAIAFVGLALTGFAVQRGTRAAMQQFMEDERERAAEAQLDAAATARTTAAPAPTPSSVDRAPTPVTKANAATRTAATRTAATRTAATRTAATRTAATRTAITPATALRAQVVGISGSMSRDVVVRTVRHNVARFRACVPPTAAGAATVQFMIGRDGEVTSSRAADATLGASMVQCLTRQTAAMQFPAPAGGKVASVQLRFATGA